MRDTLVHRGPDQCGSWVDASGACALGHRRLAIIDLSEEGRQPMSNEDGTVWISYNGEVYNHLELRRDLERRHAYRSRTDTETLVHLYEELGPAFVEELEGMFAIAIWDSRKGELVLARDRLGVKPLYFAHDDRGVVFGSEPKAIVRHPQISGRLDEHSLYDFLTLGFAPLDRSLFKGMSQVLPAEVVTFGRDRQVSRKRYWNPLTSAEVPVAERSDEEAVTQLRDNLRESIRMRTMSDVPFGAFLSGGLDSSANVALMSEVVEGPINTFSTAPAVHGKYDELEWARKVARRFGTNHREVKVTEEQALEFTAELTEHQDIPAGDPVAIPMHFVSKLARESGVIVVQVGEGSDELFHGYRGYHDHRIVIPRFQRLPRPVQRGIAAAARKAGRFRPGLAEPADALTEAANSDVPYWGGMLVFREPFKEKLWRGGTHPRSLNVAESFWHEAHSLRPGIDLLSAMTYLELNQRLPNLLLSRVDLMSMAVSIEAREPFLDRTLVEFALTLPPSMKVDGRVGKVILRRALDGLLPDDVIHRPKQGFGTPTAEWMRGSLGQHAEQVIKRSSLAATGVLDMGMIDLLWREHRSGRRDRNVELWRLYQASSWHDRWVD